MAIAFRTNSAKTVDASDPFSQDCVLPADMVADDIVLVLAATIAGGSISITADGSITPWTPIQNIDVTGGEKLYAWWGRFASGSTGPTVVATTDHLITSAAAYSGCLTGATPIDVSGTGSETTSDTSLSYVTGLSTTVDNCMCFLASSAGQDSNTSQHASQANANLASIAERLDHQTNAGGGGGYQLVEGTLATAGAIGTWTTTLATNSPKAYMAFALKPQVAVAENPFPIIGGGYYG